MIKAVVFDFDGLIIDTETPWYIAYKEVFSDLGVELPLAEWAKVVGTNFSVFDPFQYLEQQLKRSVDRNELTELTKIKFEAIIENQQARPGVESFLQEAKSLGLNIGLATSSNRKWIDYFLHKLGLASYFETIHTSDDVQHIKPDPELYIKAHQSLKAKAYETLAFEDSLNGLKAAKAAGLHCIIVPNEVTKQLNFENYDKRIDSMENHSLSELIAEISKK